MPSTFEAVFVGLLYALVIPLGVLYIIQIWLEKRPPQNPYAVHAHHQPQHPSLVVGVTPGKPVTHSPQQPTAAAAAAAGSAATAAGSINTSPNAKANAIRATVMVTPKADAYIAKAVAIRTGAVVARSTGGGESEGSTFTSVEAHKTTNLATLSANESPQPRAGPIAPGVGIAAAQAAAAAAAAARTANVTANAALAITVPPSPTVGSSGPVTFVTTAGSSGGGGGVSANATASPDTGTATVTGATTGAGSAQQFRVPVSPTHYQHHTHHPSQVLSRVGTIQSLASGGGGGGPAQTVSAVAIDGLSVAIGGNSVVGTSLVQPPSPKDGSDNEQDGKSRVGGSLFRPNPNPGSPLHVRPRPAATQIQIEMPDPNSKTTKASAGTGLNSTINAAAALAAVTSGGAVVSPANRSGGSNGSKERPGTTAIVITGPTPVDPLKGPTVAFVAAASAPAAASAASSLGATPKRKPRVEPYSLQWWLHRVGVTMAFSGLVAAIDPEGTFGIWPYTLVQANQALFIALVQEALALWIRFTVQVLYGQARKEMPRWFTPALLVGPILFQVFLVCFTFIPMGYTGKAIWLLPEYIVVNLYLLTTLSLIIYIYFTVSGVLSKFLVSVQRAATGPANRGIDTGHVKSALNSLRRFVLFVCLLDVILLCVQVPAMIAYAIRSAADPDADVPPPSDHISTNNIASSLLIMTFAWAVLWYSWTPIYATRKIHPIALARLPATGGTGGGGGGGGGGIVAGTGIAAAAALAAAAPDGSVVGTGTAAAAEAAVAAAAAAAAADGSGARGGLEADASVLTAAANPELP